MVKLHSVENAERCQEILRKFNKGFEFMSTFNDSDREECPDCGFDGMYVLLEGGGVELDCHECGFFRFYKITKGDG